jgi:hypothetical protein
MACKVCFLPKVREYVTALLMAHAGKRFPPAAIARIAAAANRTAADFTADLATLPALVAGYPIGSYPATIGLAAARDHLFRTCRGGAQI